MRARSDMRPAAMDCFRPAGTAAVVEGSEAEGRASIRGCLGEGWALAEGTIAFLRVLRTPFFFGLSDRSCAWGAGELWSDWVGSDGSRLVTSGRAKVGSTRPGFL